MSETLLADSRMARDVNGRTLLSEQRQFLDERGIVDPSERDFWLRLWAVCNDERAQIRADEREEGPAGGQGLEG